MTIWSGMNIKWGNGRNIVLNQLIERTKRTILLSVGDGVYVQQVEQILSVKNSILGHSTSSIYEKGGDDESCGCLLERIPTRRNEKRGSASDQMVHSSIWMIWFEVYGTCTNMIWHCHWMLSKALGWYLHYQSGKQGGLGWIFISILFHVVLGSLSNANRNEGAIILLCSISITLLIRMQSLIFPSCTFGGYKFK